MPPGRWPRCGAAGFRIRSRPPSKAPGFVLEWNILPAIFGLYELQVEKPIIPCVGFRAAFGIFDGLLREKP